MLIRLLSKCLFVCCQNAYSFHGLRPTLSLSLPLSPSLSLRAPRPLSPPHSPSDSDSQDALRDSAPLPTLGAEGRRPRQTGEGAAGRAGAGGVLVGWRGGLFGAPDRLLGERVAASALAGGAHGRRGWALFPCPVVMFLLVVTVLVRSGSLGMRCGGTLVSGSLPRVRCGADPPRGLALAAILLLLAAAGVVIVVVAILLLLVERL
mmetsp:Transcript_52005/g.156080  ORF Transcript_52005/g.156080 Transcript_52005/m.156080 type:complete len:206 (-) Transcript_52005:2299-2916(-)